MTTKASGTGTAFGATVSVVNHDVPTDPVALAARRREQAEAAVESARRKVERQQQHVAAAETDEKRAKQEAHLAAAQEALAQALAEQKGLN